jgi:hypothetical protein
MSNLFILIYLSGGSREVHETFQEGASYKSLRNSGVWTSECQYSADMMGMYTHIKREEHRLRVFENGVLGRIF